MAKRSSMQNIADALGVTRMSVSKALNGQPGVSPALRRRIQAKAEELGYALPTRGEGRSRHVFACLIPRRFFLETEQFYNVIFSHMNRLCQGRGSQLSLFVVEEEQERAGRLPDALRVSGWDGIFLLGQEAPRLVDAAFELDLPVVCVDFYQHKLSTDFVLSDNFFLGYWAAMELAEKGHLRIGFVGDRYSTSSVTDRYFGYRKALSLAGLPFREEWVFSNNRYESGEYTEKVTLPGELPDAFLCHCEMAAYYLQMTLRGEGLRVPEDVSLIAFGNTELGRSVMGNLTTFEMGRGEMAAAAVRLMLLRVEEGAAPTGRHYVRSHLLERGSIADKRQL